MTEMSYKQDFLFQMVTTFVYMVVQVLSIKYLFLAGGITQIYGYSMAQVYFVFALIQLFMMLHFIFTYPSLETARWQIFRGQIDFYLVKPINTIYQISMQRIKISAGLAIFGYLFFLFYLSRETLVVIDVFKFAQLVFLVFFAFGLFYFMIWISTTAWFFWSKFESLRWLIHNSQDITRYPKKIYPQFLQSLLIYVLPMFLMINPAYDILQNEFGWSDFGRMIMMLIMFGLIYLIMWKEGLRRYNSAA